MEIHSHPVKHSKIQTADSLVFIAAQRIWSVSMHELMCFELMHTHLTERGIQEKDFQRHPDPVTNVGAKKFELVISRRPNWAVWGGRAVQHSGGMAVVAKPARAAVAVWNCPDMHNSLTQVFIDNTVRWGFCSPSPQTNTQGAFTTMFHKSSAWQQPWAEATGTRNIHVQLFHKRMLQ